MSAEKKRSFLLFDFYVCRVLASFLCKIVCLCKNYAAIHNTHFQPKAKNTYTSIQKKNIIRTYLPQTSDFSSLEKKGIYVRQFLAHKRILLVVSHGFTCVLRCLRLI